MDPTEDFVKKLAAVRFWDQDLESLLQQGRAPEVDAALQIRAEVEDLCRWIAAAKIRSYLEIGVWTGRLISKLQEIFAFERCGACDMEMAKNQGLEITLPKKAVFFRGNSRSPIFFNWIQLNGPFELVLVDAQRDAAFAQQMFEQQRSLGTKHVAFVGISPDVRGETGVRDFWRSLSGTKHEIIKPHKEIGLEHSTIGIGIWSNSKFK